MSRSASTLDRTEEIFGLLEDSNLKARAYIEVWDGSSWILIPDLNESKGIDWTEDRRRFAYSNFSLTPTASSIGFEVINLDGKYSEGSGSIYEEILSNNSKVKLTSGYKLSTPVDLTETVLLSGFIEKYLTQYSGGLIIPNISGTETLGRFQDLFNTYYDTILYDSSTYTPLGYVVYSIDNLYKTEKVPKTINLTCTFAGGAVYWKEVDYLFNEAGLTNSTNWNLAGTTVSGSNAFTIAGTGKRYLVIAIVFDGADWSTSTNVSALSVTYDNYIEWIYKSVFYLDSPSYIDPPSPLLPKISISGRDAYKKALETKMNVEDLTGATIDDAIKQVCDRCGIFYSASSIDNLSFFSVRSLSNGLGTIQTGDIILAKLILLANQFGSTKYEIYLSYDSTIDDKILFVKPRPSSYSASVVMDYRKYKQLGSLKKNYDKLLSRFSIYTSEPSVNKQELLGTSIVSVSGDVTISWSGNAIFLNYDFLGIGSATLTDITPTSITFNFSVDPSMTINVYGCKFNGAEPTYWSEYINHNNMIYGGIDDKQINEFLISSDEAKSVCKALVADYGSPLYEASNISFSKLNLILENNDICFVWSRNLLIDRLFYIVGISYHWDRSSSPQDSTSFKLQDTGRRFSDVGSFKWDDVEKWDIGYVWDQDLGVLSTSDPNNYNRSIPVEFS